MGCTIADFRDKEVINICDGRRLGYVIDVEFDVNSGRILSIVLPGHKGGLLNFGKSEDNAWWVVDSSGKVMDKVPQGMEDTYTKILGVHIMDPEIGEQAVAQETAVPDVDENGDPIPVTVTAAQQLTVALNIADYLEQNGIIGQAASIDVNDLGNIQVWYGQQYQIKLGDESQLSHKISLAKAAIDTLSEQSHNSGVLDASLTVDKTGVRYTRFQ